MLFKLSTVLGALSLVSQVLAFETKEYTSEAGLKYVYDFAPADGEKATFLLVHGYPSSRREWRGQIEALTKEGYGVIVPDCIGYGDSDKPTDLEAYNLKQFSGDLVKIIESHDIPSVVAVGHDWGCILLARAVVWYPATFEKLVLLSAGYNAPGLFFDIDAANAWGLKNLGYMQWGYWYFFNSYNAVSLITSKLESYFSLIFNPDNSKTHQYFAGLGAARSWLTADNKTEIAPYLNEEFKSTWLEQMKAPNAVQGGLSYYQALMRGVQNADEAKLTDEDRKLKMPVLTIGGKYDMVTRADQLGPRTKPWTTQGYSEKTVEAGHWIILEAADALTEALLEFVA